MTHGLSQLAGGSRLSRSDQRPTQRTSGAENRAFRRADSLRRLERKASKRCGTDANISDEKTLRESRESFLLKLFSRQIPAARLKSTHPHSSIPMWVCALSHPATHYRENVQVTVAAAPAGHSAPGSSGLGRKRDPVPPANPSGGHRPPLQRGHGSIHQLHYPRGARGDSGIMRGHDQRARRSSRKAQSKWMISSPGVRIQVAGRLIRQNHIGRLISARAMAIRCCSRRTIHKAGDPVACRTPPASADSRPFAAVPGRRAAPCAPAGPTFSSALNSGSKW